MGYFKISPEVLEREDWLLARKMKLDPSKMTEEAKKNLEFLPRNKKGDPIIMGGSDLGVALGKSPYKSNRDLWLELAGEKDPKDISSSPAIIRGNTWEKPIFDVLTQIDLPAEFEGEEIVFGIDKHTYGIEGEPFVINTDGWCRIGNDLWLIEIKTLDAFQREKQMDWLDGIVPETYECQCRLYNHVLPQFKGVIICCAWGLENNMRTHIFIERDEAIEKELVDAALAFIKTVENGDEPEEKKYVEGKISLSDDAANELARLASENMMIKEAQGDNKSETKTFIEKIKGIFDDGNKASGSLEDGSVVNLNRRKDGSFYISYKPVGEKNHSYTSKIA